MKVTAIVPAAGVGSRIAKKKCQKKPFFIVNNKPILIHTLLALENSKRIDDIIVVVHKDDLAKWKTAVKKYGLKKISSVIPGGKTRHESVKAGLSFLADDSSIVFIHDGVRPLINNDIISNLIKMCRVFGAAVAGVPVVSTVKLVDKVLKIKSTPDRREFYIAQTPQVFKKDIIVKAYSKTTKPTSSITDDSMLVESLGYKVMMVPGSYENIKVTTPQDLVLTEALLKMKSLK